LTYIRKEIRASDGGWLAGPRLGHVPFPFPWTAVGGFGQKNQASYSNSFGLGWLRFEKIIEILLLISK